MKSFIIVFVLSLVATLAGAAPVADPQTTEAPVPTTPTSEAPAPTTTTSALVYSPSPLADYQYPVILPNGAECIGPYLVMTMSADQPDQTFPKVRQIGPNAFVALEFNSTHAGKTCRFHFAFSNLADGGNSKGTEDVYALKSGSVDENLTFNNQPVLESDIVASFNMTGPAKLVDGTPGRHELFPAVSRFDFPCPTQKTGWAIRGSNGSLHNWSWNHGLIVEVLGDIPWTDGVAY